MVTIGIRAAPREVSYAIFNSETDTLVNVDEIKIPRAFDVPDSLKYVRGNILDILREYSVERAGVRVFEAVADNQSIPRVQIEGVIQEAFASSALKSYYIGRSSSISHRIGISTSDFRAMVKGEMEFRVEGWEKLTPAKREAVLCAVGAARD